VILKLRLYGGTSTFSAYFNILRRLRLLRLHLPYERRIFVTKRESISIGVARDYIRQNSPKLQC